MPASVLPYRWNDETAADYAQQHDAVLAVGRSQARLGQISLSPLSLRTGPAPARVVLPSPNGSTIAYHLSAGPRVCLTACLRNAAAVTRWIAGRFEPTRTAVAVIAAGEQWPTGGLRPAVEDLWGAGAVVAGLRAQGWSARSPEAQMAQAGYASVKGDMHAALRACASGRELVAHDHGADVEIAAEVDASRAVPLLQGQHFSPGNYI